MQSLHEAWWALQLGGVIMLPLSLLAILALAVIADKFWLYRREALLPAALRDLVESWAFDWAELARASAALTPGHHFRQLFELVLSVRERPLWWIESRVADQAQLMEKQLARRLWVLETVVTAAPLMGLLGTILGMMHAFRLIGSKGLVNPTGVTGGVAEALIATAVGLFIALLCLFAFNYLSRLQASTMDEVERLSTRLIDHIRLDREAA